MGIPVRQEPKYCICDGKITNRQSGKAIPPEEPIFILRARDIHAVELLGHYLNRVQDDHHASVVDARIKHFRDFAEKYPERMKEPDTDKSIELTD